MKKRDGYFYEIVPLIFGWRIIYTDGASVEKAW